MSQTKQDFTSRNNAVQFVTNAQCLALLDKIQKKTVIPEFDINQLVNDNTSGKNGLKTEQDVRAFLKTPKAQAEIVKYAKDIAVKKDLLEETLFQMILRKILKLFLLSAKKYAKKKQEYYQKLNEAYQQQYDNQKEKRKKAEKRLTDEKKSARIYLAEFELIDMEISKLEQELAEIQDKIASLREQIKLVDMEIEQESQRYSIYEQGIAKVVADLSHPEAQTAETLDRHLRSIEDNIAKKTEKYSLKLSDPDITPEKISKNLHKLESLHMQHGIVKNHQDVVEGRLRYWDNKYNIVENIADAVFMMAADKRFVQDQNGQPMIIDSNLNPEHMSLEERNQARNHFLAGTHHQATLGHQLTAQKQEALRPLFAMKQERELNLSQTVEASMQLVSKLRPSYAKLNQFTKDLINNISSLESTAQMLLQLDNPNAPRPSMRPEPQNSAKKFKEELEELRKTGKSSASPERLRSLVELLPETLRPQGLKLLDSSLTRQQRNSPISANQWSYLLRQLELMGQGAPKLQAMKEQKPQLENVSATAPTPLSTRPSPYNNK